MDQLLRSVLNEMTWQAKHAQLQFRTLITDHWVALPLLTIGALLLRAMVWWELAAPFASLSSVIPGAWEIGAATLLYVSFSLYLMGFAVQSEITYDEHPRIRHNSQTDEDEVEYPKGNRGVLSVSLVVISAIGALTMGVSFAIVLIMVALQTAAHVPRGLDAIGQGVLSHVGIMLCMVFLLWMLLVA